MYIDVSRLADLNDLKKIRDDVTELMSHRRAAKKALDKILKQIHDPLLAKLRERLLKATLASDVKEMWKIRNQIKSYLKQEIFIEGKDYGRS